jgi:dCMP deaminase
MVDCKERLIKMINEKWDLRFLNMAKEMATWSKDRSSKVGCIIVGPNREIRTSGYNGMPRGVNDEIDSRHERPLKYSYFEHSERNAIYNAARIGISLDGCTLYCGSTLMGPPCVDCARALIQSGITRVVGSKGDNDPSLWEERWKASMLISIEMFNEAGIIFDTV